MAAFGPITVSLEFPQGPPPSPSRNASLAADDFVELALSSSDDDVPFARVRLAPPVLLDAILADMQPAVPPSTSVLPPASVAPATPPVPSVIASMLSAANCAPSSVSVPAPACAATAAMPALELAPPPVVYSRRPRAAAPLAQPHEAIAKKKRVYRKRASLVLHVRRSARLAELEPYRKETIQDKASKAKAKRLMLSSSARDFEDAVRTARLYPDAAQPGSPRALAALALECGSSPDEAEWVASTAGASAK